MANRLPVSVRVIIKADPSQVLAAAQLPIPTNFADPTAPTVDGNTLRYGSVPDVARSLERTATIVADGTKTELVLEGIADLHLPFFGWLMRPLVRRATRTSLEHMAATIGARATGTPEGKTPKRPLWAPRDRLIPERAASIATVCAVLAVANFSGSLFTQTIHFVALTFVATDAALGLVLALTRLGALVGLTGSILSDRRGRRTVLLGSLVVVLVSGAVSAFAPNLAILGLLQILNRGSFNLAVIVGYIVITEEASEGGRAYMLGIGNLAAGFGFAIAAGILPVADLAPEAWRWIFGINIPLLLLLPGLAKSLAETERYSKIAGRTKSSSTKQLVDKDYGKRLALVALVGMLLNFFAAPFMQLTNRYLGAERGFSGLGILVVRFFTQGAPAVAAVWLGGRIAETSGRITVAARATAMLAIASAAFFLTDGALLWITLLMASLGGALAGPSLTAFNTEMFPTETRGRAGGILLAVQVAGSAAGLLTAGLLARPLGSVGAAIAVTAVAPLIAAIFLIPQLPEARGLLLDEVSPPKV